MEIMRIYVACLASYNNGRLHGAWLDLDDYVDAEDLSKAVKEQVLITSPYPNVMVECPECEGVEEVMVVRHGCDDAEVRRLGLPSITTWHRCSHCHGTGEVPSAEEWAIHDHEGFPEGSVGEYTSFDKLYEIRERIAEAEEEFGDDGQEILEAFEHCFGTNDTPISTIRGAYRGKYDSGAEMEQEFAIETGQIKDDSHFFHYIDWERVWKDDCDISEHNGHFFWSNW